jgi:hypothetical protein
VDSGELRFAILSPRGEHMSRGVYAAYHGHFVEMLLNHFDEDFTKVMVTALPARGDNIGA